MADKRDYYEVLGVDRTASDKEIADAYRTLALKHHPDRNPGDEEAVKLFKEAAEAFEVLNDEQKRARYDRYGHAGLEGGGGGGFQDVSDIFSAFSDIFGDDVFGGIFGGGGRGRRASRGSDVRCAVRLDLTEAARGVSREIEFLRHVECETCEGSGARPGSEPERCEYCAGNGQVVQAAGFVRVQRTCPACHGQGSVIRDPCRGCGGTGYTKKKVSREVKIPAGIDNGMELRIPGEGNPSSNGGPRGDCFVAIQVLKHPLFEREGQDLICRIPISYSQAVLGAEIEVPTLEGRQQLSVPAGTQSGEVFTLRGRGLPVPRRRGQGNLHVQVNIDVPKNVSEEQEELLRQLAELEHSNVSPQRKSFLDRLRDFFVSEDD